MRLKIASPSHRWSETSVDVHKTTLRSLTKYQTITAPLVNICVMAGSTTEGNGGWGVSRQTANKPGRDSESESMGAKSSGERSDTHAQYNCGASAVSELGGSNTGDSQREQINPQLSNMTDKHKSITAKLHQALGGRRWQLPSLPPNLGNELLLGRLPQGKIHMTSYL